jgi:hypothetical protein
VNGKPTRSRGRLRRIGTSDEDFAEVNAALLVVVASVVAGAVLAAVLL